MSIPFGDADALRAAIGEHTVAFLVEPVQGEAGVIIPPPGYLAAARAICDEAGILLIADEVQTGLGRTGRRFGCDHEDVTPDVYLLGKALGGGILPLSAVWPTTRCWACSIQASTAAPSAATRSPARWGARCCGCSRTAGWPRTPRSSGARPRTASRAGSPGAVTAIRQIGLWIALDIKPSAASAREVCELLADRGVLCKDTHDHTIRIAPPLVTSAEDLDWALDRIESVLTGLGV